MTLEARLELWIVDRCGQQNPQPQQYIKLNAIFRSIYNDRRFWRYRNEENRDYYEDALALMWRYFVLNLCEATTARTSGSFLETRTYAVGRLLTNLKGHLRNIQEQRRREFSDQEEPRINDDGTVTDPVDKLPNPEPELAPRQWDEFVRLLEEDKDGELNAEDNTLRGREGAYTLTAQTFLLMYYRDGMTIHEIAEELHIPRGSLQGGAKPTRWKALARKYAGMAMESVSQSGGEP